MNSYQLKVGSSTMNLLMAAKTRLTKAKPKNWFIMIEYELSAMRFMSLFLPMAGVRMREMRSQKAIPRKLMINGINIGSEILAIRDGA